MRVFHVINAIHNCTDTFHIQTYGLTKLSPAVYTVEICKKNNTAVPRPTATPTAHRTLNLVDNFEENCMSPSRNAVDNRKKPTPLWRKGFFWMASFVMLYERFFKYTKCRFIPTLCRIVRTHYRDRGRMREKLDNILWMRFVKIEWRSFKRVILICRYIYLWVFVIFIQFWYTSGAISLYWRYQQQTNPFILYVSTARRSGIVLFSLTKKSTWHFSYLSNGFLILFLLNMLEIDFRVWDLFISQMS